MPANDPDLPHESEDIDRKIRLNESREEIREVSGQEPAAWTSPDCPPDVEEKFYRNMLAWERGPFITQFDQLTRDGFDFPEASQLDDTHLSAKLPGKCAARRGTSG